MELKDATRALSALGHATRLAIFRLLVEAGPEGMMAGEVADRLDLPGATLSFHLKELSGAGLIRGEPRGRHICYRAEFEAMEGLIAFLTHNCCGGDQSQCAPAARASAARASAATMAGAKGRQ